MLAGCQALSSHLVWLGTTPWTSAPCLYFLYCFREREGPVAHLEMVSGQRMMRRISRIGDWRSTPPLGS